MSRMSIRATFALDENTTRRIKRLAAIWGVSQAEVVRRSVCQADAAAAKRLSPADVVAHYASGTLPRSKGQTRELVASLRALRHDDDVQRRTPDAP